MTVEAGSELPKPEAFLKTDTGESVAYGSGFALVRNTVPGNYPVTIRCGKNSYQSTLCVADTVPPTASPVPVLVMAGQTTRPEAFVTGINDATAVTASYSTQPDFNTPGTRNVTVTLTDLGQNVTNVTAELTVVGVLSSIEVDALDETVDLQASDFLTQPDAPVNASFVKGYTKQDLLKPGEVPITIEANGLQFDTALSVVDTEPPVAISADVSLWLGDTVDASAFTSNVTDLSPVSFSYAAEPDFTLEGEQEVTVIIEDAYNNRTELTARLTITRDTEPPVISGARNLSALIGDKVSYRSGVSASDNRDGDVTVSVSSGQVNLNAEGIYPLTYSAVDASGNKATVSVTVTVYALTESVVNDLADGVLSKIITDDMSDYDKAQKIFNWVTGNVQYTGSSAKDSTAMGAYLGFKNKNGDCFTFYAVSEYLLTRAGIPNERVTRIGGTTQHFWNIVDVGTGWYHFDTCPSPSKAGHFNRFLFTSVQAAEYTELIKTKAGKSNYYTYDASLYPRIIGDPEVSE